MAAYNPPWTITASSQTAESWRRMLWYNNATHNSCVVGSGSLAVSQHAGTPNMSVDVAEGAAVILGTEASYQGAYFCEAQGVTNLAISAAHATLARYDLVVAKVQDQQYSGATNSWSLAVVTGTAAASPKFPAVPANAMVIAVVQVDAAVTQILNAKITDLRYGSMSDGTTTLSNPGYSVSVGGSFIYPSFTPTTQGIGSPTLSCWYELDGDMVHAHYVITLTGAGSATSILIGLPVTAHTSERGVFRPDAMVHANDNSAAQDIFGVTKIESSGTSVSFWTGTATLAAWTLWAGTTVPFVWATSDKIEFSIRYRKA